MHSFTALLQQFGEKGEKTGWTYVDIPSEITEALRPGQKTSFRVKGGLDTHVIERVALLPMGSSDASGGQFIMAINATMRRGLRKEAGATIRVELAVDDSPLPQSADLVACLQDEPKALAFFQTLRKGHQIYFNNWIEDAKTVQTRTRRIAQAVGGLAMGLSYSEMIRYHKRKKEE
ncbi:MAG: DUF1905 domain-containing protein [Bacteroidetes bacterium]|nr:DUF1905 domain-containing protein [Fibrella sp.]